MSLPVWVTAVSARGESSPYRPSPAAAGVGVSLTNFQFLMPFAPRMLQLTSEEQRCVQSEHNGRTEFGAPLLPSPHAGQGAWLRVPTAGTLPGWVVRGAVRAWTGLLGTEAPQPASLLALVREDPRAEPAAAPTGARARTGMESCAVGTVLSNQLRAGLGAGAVPPVPAPLVRGAPSAPRLAGGCPKWSGASAPPMPDTRTGWQSRALPSKGSCPGPWSWPWLWVLLWVGPGPPLLLATWPLCLSPNPPTQDLLSLGCYLLCWGDGGEKQCSGRAPEPALLVAPLTANRAGRGEGDPDPLCTDRRVPRRR